MSVFPILIVEDDQMLQEALVDTLEAEGFSVSAVNNGKCALDKLEKQNYSLVISDVQMKKMNGHQLHRQMQLKFPDVPIVLMTAFGSVQQAVDSIQLGAVDYLTKPVEADVLIKIAKRYQKLAELDDFIAIDEKTKQLKLLAKRVAASDATIMITGQSGSGKEVLAKYIHQNSDRHTGPFVAINCAAIPENMLEATLFGYEKGAFTGAYQANPGKFEQAQGGTLLLDEISEMDLGLQAKLLRVIQEKEVERLGGRKTISLDVRVLATSNQNMREAVAKNTFREDLYYRLNVFPINLIGLAERRGDIVPIAQRLIQLWTPDSLTEIPELDASAISKLENYAWPGNVRELDNVIQRALILHKNNVINETDILFEVESVSKSTLLGKKSAPKQEDEAPVLMDLKTSEHKMIVDTLTRLKGSRKDTADFLGVSQRTLRYKIAKIRDAGFVIPSH